MADKKTGEIETIRVGLDGVADIMFDRFQSMEDAERVEVEDKLYRRADGTLFIPGDNIQSMLCAQRNSIIKRLYGKKAADILQEAAAQIIVETDENILTRDGQPIVYTGWDEQREDKAAGLYQHFATARLYKNGQIIPNPKHRPVLHKPWHLEFTLTIMRFAGGVVNTERVREWLEIAGRLIGLGTYRPRYGRYELTTYEEA